MFQLFFIANYCEYMFDCLIQKATSSLVILSYRGPYLNISLNNLRYPLYSLIILNFKSIRAFFFRFVNDFEDKLSADFIPGIIKRMVCVCQNFISGWDLLLPKTFAKNPI
jgi:hypothetical protein